MALWAYRDRVRLVVVGTPILWLRSIAGSCSLVGTFYSLTRLPPSDVLTLCQLFPVWVAILAWPMLGSLPHWSVWIALFSSMVGVVFIGSQHIDEENVATYVVLAVSVFTALAMMGLNKLKKMDTRAIVVHFSMVSLLFSALAFVIIPAPETRVEFTWYHGIMLVGVGVTATFGQLFLTKAFTVGDPTKLSVVSLSQLVMVLFLECTVLNSPPADWRMKLLGTPLIIGPAVWLMVRSRPNRVSAPALAMPRTEAA